MNLTQMDMYNEVLGAITLNLTQVYVFMYTEVLGANLVRYMCFMQ